MQSTTEIKKMGYPAPSGMDAKSMFSIEILSKKKVDFKLFRPGFAFILLQTSIHYILHFNLDYQVNMYDCNNREHHGHIPVRSQ